MHSTGLFFKGLALAAITATVATACSTLPNKDRVGLDLTNIQAPITDCARACTAYKVCATWTWSEYNGGTCWLKKSIGPLADKAGVTATECTYNGIEPECSALPNKDRPGFDLVNARGTIDDCNLQCFKLKNCMTWTWSNHNGGTCWLKSRAGELVDKAGVTSTTCMYQQSTAICSPFKDIDFVGMDIGSKPAPVADKCCDICNGFSGCTAYAWNAANNGTCYLKKSVGHVIAKPGVVSSSLVWLGGAVCPFEYDTDFEGLDFANKPAKDAGVCCSQCKDSSGCKAYTWSNHNGGTCWMKSGKGKAVTKAGVISAKLAYA